MRTELERLTDKRLNPEEKAIRRINESGVIRTPLQSRKLANERLRTAIAELTEANINEVQMWLDVVAFDDPAKALDLLLRMLEFSVPKLSRVEANITREDSAGIQDLTIGDLQRIVNDARTIQGSAKQVEPDGETEDAEFEDLL